MDQREVLRHISKMAGGIIAVSAALAAGISRMTLSKLCERGELQRIGRGQYILPGELPDELLALSMRTEHLIFSHETALFLHGISDRTPFVHSITYPSNQVPSQALREEVKVYYIKPELFAMGRTEIKTPFGSEVPCYDLERTICDIVRSRSKMGSETFLAALKMYAASPKKDLNRLNHYAGQMGLTNVIRQYLEVLL